MMFYYYTKWRGGDGLPIGIYHSTWVTEDPPAAFLGRCTDNILEFRRFSSEKAMNTFWARQCNSNLDEIDV